MTTNYSAGAAVEYRVVNLFRSWGYEARRVAGSHGPFDVIALNPSEVILVQCKKFRGRLPNFDKDKAMLAAVPAPQTTEKFLAVWEERKGWLVWWDIKRTRQINWRTNTSKPKQRKKA